MAQSTVSGLTFELNFAEFLLKEGKRCNEETTVKIQKLHTKYQWWKPDDILFHMFKRVLDSLELTYGLVKQFYMGKDSNGHDINGDTSDFYLECTNGTVLPASLKMNNDSMKSFSPRKLPEKMNIQGSTYTLDDIINAFYDKHGNKLFKDVEKQEKHTLFKQINERVQKFVLEQGPAAQSQWYRYMIGSKTPIIIQWERKNMQMHLKIFSPETIVSNVSNKLTVVNYVAQSPSTYIVTFSNGIEFSLRLHNAKSKITRSVYIKWDAKLTNMTKSYKIYTYRFGDNNELMGINI